MTDFNTNARYDMITKLQKGNMALLSDNDDSYRGGNAFTSLTLVAVGIAVGMVLLTVVRSCDREADPVAAINQIRCDVCHSRVAEFTKYFKKIGSKNPQAMAEAVMSTRNPKLMAAIAKVESRGDHTLRNTGYKKRHHGAFQVSEKDWGTVPSSPTLQAQQAQAILDELQGKKQNIRTALNLYGGDRTKKRYASDVLRELREVP